MKLRLLTSFMLLLGALCLQAQPLVSQSHPWRGARVAYFGDSVTDPRNSGSKVKYWHLLQQWLEERTEPSLGFLKFTKALEDFNNWLLIGGNRTWQRKRFSEAMKLHRKEKIRRETGYGFPGICLKL